MSVELLKMIDALRLEIRAASYQATGVANKDKSRLSQAEQTRLIASVSADFALNLAQYREDNQ